MKYKSPLLTIVFILALSLGAISFVQLAGARERPPIGPYTDIRLPINGLPKLNLNLVFNPQNDQYPSGANLQILYVVEDFRDVPLARFAYSSQENNGVVSPTLFPASAWDELAPGLTSYTEELERLEQSNPKTINVYVRVQAPPEKFIEDPVFGDYYQDKPFGGTFANLHTSGGRPNLYIYHLSKTNDRDPVFNSYLCAVPEYADGTPPYQLPGDIEGGKAIREDGLYDPKAFAPPHPWYYSDDPMLIPGEVREGWISCMAPDVPLDEIQIRARYTYTTSPLPTPTPGSSPTPWPSPSVEDGDITLENCEGRDDCAVVDDLADPVCAEVEICLLRPVPTDEAMLDPTPDATELVLQKTTEAEDYLPQEYEADRIAWSYASPHSIPDTGLRLEDVSLGFVNAQGEELTGRGAATFQTAHILHIENQLYLRDRIRFVSRVTVEPRGLTEEDLEGFTLAGIGAYIEVYDQPTGPFDNASYNPGPQDYYIHYDDYFTPTLSSSTSIFSFSVEENPPDWLPVNYQLDTGDPSEGPQPFSELLLHQPDSPLEGYVFAGLDNQDERSLGFHTYHEQKEAPPAVMWFSISSGGPGYQSYKPLYPSQTVNIHSDSLEPSTNMCEFVDCLDVSDPAAPNQETRTVPILCPGEWANNFILDDLKIENLEYLGEPYGLGPMEPLYKYISFREKNIRTWIYTGKFLGGLSPWWLYNPSSYGGKILDRASGQYVDTQPIILPYYSRENRTYYLPADESQHMVGWMPDIVRNKLLIFGLIDEDRYSKENTAYLFQEEGPAWSHACSRSLLPALTSPKIYTSPLTGGNQKIVGNPHMLTDVMPGMSYPVSQPRISGEVLPLGEDGGAIYNQVLKPVEVLIVPGRKNKPVVFVPEEDRYYPAKENVSANNEEYFRNVDAKLIPPDSSLIMVKIRKVPPGGKLSTHFTNKNFQLSYPHYYPITSLPGSLRTPGLISYSRPDNFTEEWLFFYFPSLDIDREQLLFTIRGEEKWIFWHLTEK